MVEKKINGFDAYDVKDAARKILEVEEIKNRPKFYKTVKKQLAKDAKEIHEALKEHKVKTNLKKVLGD